MENKLSAVKDGRGWLLGLIALSAVIGVMFLPPISQDPGYHRFADARTLVGIPNFWNVISNSLFMLIGVLGLLKHRRKEIRNPGIAYLLFCSGVFLVGIGSGYYHYSPSADSLVWDRLPITVSFMALFSMVVRDRVSENIGDLILWPLVVAGVTSVGYWYWTELSGRGDLRPYVVIQFLPMLLIPMMLIMYAGRAMRTSWLWATLGAYALAKLAEHFDVLIYSSIQVLSGHSIKHVLGALAVFCAIVSCRQARKLEANS
jgi:hypothetical protein